jgi:hypothetical protein
MMKTRTLFHLLEAPMIERITPSRLRANLYRILDQVLASRKPVEIERKGERLRIVVDRPRNLKLLRPHPGYLKVPQEDIVHIDWSGEWRP